MTGDDVFGPGGLATRFAWGGAVFSIVIWVFTARRSWQTEGSPHHLVAQLLSIATMIGLDVVIIIFLWPSSVFPRPEFLSLSSEEARILVAFVIGMQVAAALWQITAPPQGWLRKVPRRAGHLAQRLRNRQAVRK